MMHNTSARERHATRLAESAAAMRRKARAERWRKMREQRDTTNRNPKEG